MMTSPSSLSAEYYNFDRYIDRARWLTYYEQIRVVLSAESREVLEVGVGPGVVRSVLGQFGAQVTTVDINASLRPDYVADLRSLPPTVREIEWDVVLCARILHHIPMSEIPDVLKSLSALSAKRIIVTVPREDLSLQMAVRRTAGRAHIGRVSFGGLAKRQLRKIGSIKSAPSGVWMLDGISGPSRTAFEELLRRWFLIKNSYVLEDDPSHVLFVLEPAR